MAKKLEDFINENREAFDTNEPPEGHFERFEARLPQDTKGGNDKRNPFRIVWRAAAVIVLIFGVNYALYNDDPGTDATAAPTGLSLSDISPELQEVETFYTDQLDMAVQKLDPIKGSNRASYADFRKQLESLEMDYSDLEDELESNHSDERVINSMIQNYRLRLQLIDTYLRNIARTNQTNTNTDEKASI